MTWTLGYVKSTTYKSKIVNFGSSFTASQLGNACLSSSAWRFTHLSMKQSLSAGITKLNLVTS